MKQKNELKKNTKQNNQKELKDWDSTPQSKKHRTPPKWESHIKPMDYPVRIDELESIQLSEKTL